MLSNIMIEVYMLALVFGFLTATLGDFLVFAMMDGHRIDFVKLWVAKKIAKKRHWAQEYYKLLENEERDKIYEKALSMNKMFMLTKCNYCLSIFLSIIVTPIVTLTAHYLYQDHSIWLLFVGIPSVTYLFISKY